MKKERITHLNFLAKLFLARYPCSVVLTYNDNDYSDVSHCLHCSFLILNNVDIPMYCQNYNLRSLQLTFFIKRIIEASRRRFSLMPCIELR